MEVILIITAIATVVLAAALAAVSIMCLWLVRTKLPDRDGLFTREMLEVMISAYNQGIHAVAPKPISMPYASGGWEAQRVQTAPDDDKIPDEVTLDA